MFVEGACVVAQWPFQDCGLVVYVADLLWTCYGKLV